MQTQKTTLLQNNGRILLVGDASAAFADSRGLEELHIQRSPAMLDAIALTAHNKFEMICVVVAGFVPQVRAALKTLRRINPDATIILLVQMYDEPFAIELINGSDRQPGYADDYAICPLTAEKFRSEVLKHTDAPSPSADNAAVATGQDAEMLDQLARLATEDDLTGLKNRRYAREFLRQIIERAKEERMRLTLLIFDIDNFKYYNDVYGHAAGDDILRQAAILMRHCCRRHDVVARIGGDEFAVIFWDAPKDSDLENGRRAAQGEHPHEILFIAERFRRELNAAHLPSLGAEGKGVLTISGGLAGFPSDGSEVEELFRQADNGLFEAKRSGKNSIYIVGQPDGKQQK
ncbi:MAG: GGDEF domain-containing protein [Sedimentisphaerales bacterium]|nr:GGDEF domain-containing protein [Sedimentisphaerales bacterium]